MMRPITNSERRKHRMVRAPLLEPGTDIELDQFQTDFAANRSGCLLQRGQRD